VGKTGKNEKPPRELTTKGKIGKKGKGWETGRGRGWVCVTEVRKIQGKSKPTAERGGGVDKLFRGA